MLLKDKVAVVTGAARGIGRGIALAMAGQGARVVVNDYGGTADGAGGSPTPADEVVNEIKAGGGQAVANYESVATMAGGQSIIQTALDHFGGVPHAGPVGSVLTQCAGVSSERPPENRRARPAIRASMRGAN